jgi:hypothetical protein
MLVKSYTSRRLTYPSDKLVAISGLAASTTQAKRGAEYLAGLWDESILLDLLWQAMPGASKEPLAYPRTVSRAPSWSWASIDRGVSYDDLHDVTFIAKALAGKTRLSNPENPHGSVEAGAIVLQARLRACKISWKGGIHQHRAYLVREDGTRSKEQHFISDGLLVAQPGSRRAMRGLVGGGWHDGEDLDAWFLCIAATPWVHLGFVGLLVTPSTMLEGSWERVGNITKVTREWFEGGVEQQVTLV